jgi:hypothetical protein
MMSVSDGAVKRRSKSSRPALVRLGQMADLSLSSLKRRLGTLRPLLPSQMAIAWCIHLQAVTPIMVEHLIPAPQLHHLLRPQPVCRSSIRAPSILRMRELRTHSVGTLPSMTLLLQVPQVIPAITLSAAKYTRLPVEPVKTRKRRPTGPPFRHTSSGSIPIS